MAALTPTHSDSSWGQARIWPRDGHWHGLVWLVAIFGTYLGAVLLYPAVESGGVAVLWLPNAVLVTAMLRFRRRDWPSVYAMGLLAEVLGDLTFDAAPVQGIYFGVVNALEATLVVLCAAKIAGGRNHIGLLSVRGALALACASIALPALAGALGAIGSVWTFGTEYLTAWRNWWFGDSLGLLVGVPAGLLLRDAVSSIARHRGGTAAISGLAAALLSGLATMLTVWGNAWGAQQTALAAAGIMAVVFGAVGATPAAVLLTAVTLVSQSRHEAGLGDVVQNQVLLLVVFAAGYTIAGATESAGRTMGLLSQAKRDLKTANNRLASLLEATPDALIIAGTDGRILFANAQADRVFGYPREDLIGSDVEILMPFRFRETHIRHRTNFVAGAVVRPMGAGLELWGLRRDGTEFPAAISLSPLGTGKNMQVLAAIRDVTERHALEQQLRRQRDALVETQQQLERLARFDSLTGLVNRGEVMARLKGALESSRAPKARYGVLFCDVDRFKVINDTFGHSAGDTVLQTLADRISQCVRHGDTVGRSGGDELLVLLPGLQSLVEAIQVADKIRDRASEPIHDHSQTLHATLSIGATLAIPGESVSDALERADAAMYQAKHQGGNTVCGIGFGTRS